MDCIIVVVVSITFQRQGKALPNISRPCRNKCTGIKTGPHTATVYCGIGNNYTAFRSSRMRATEYTPSLHRLVAFSPL